MKKKTPLRTERVHPPPPAGSLTGALSQSGSLVGNQTAPTDSSQTTGASESGEVADYVLIVQSNLLVSRNMVVNGPLADVYVKNTLRNRGSFETTGKLLVGALDNQGQIETKETQTGVPDQRLEQSPPTVEEFTKDQMVIHFGSGFVEVLDRDGSLISRSTDRFFTDPSDAVWRYKAVGKGAALKGKDFWAIKGDTPSKLEGYSLVFDTNFRNPHKVLDVFDGGIYVKGNLSNSGELFVRDKPDEPSLVVLGDAFLRNRAEIVGKIHVGGRLKLVGEEDADEADEDEELENEEGGPSGGSGNGGQGKPDCPGKSCDAPGQQAEKPSCPGNSCDPGQGNQGQGQGGGQGGGQGQGDQGKAKKQVATTSEPFVNIEGAVYVAGDFDAQVSFKLNNLALVQAVTLSQVAGVLGEDIAGSLEWVATTPSGSIVEGKPAVAVAAFRPIAEVSLMPPRSLVSPRKQMDIHGLRSRYRLAEQGHLNPVLEEIEEEHVMYFVMGDSMDYSPLLHGGPTSRLLRGIRDTIWRLKAEGHSQVELKSHFFYPRHLFHAIFLVDGQTVGPFQFSPEAVNLQPRTGEDIAFLKQDLAAAQAEPEGIEYRVAEWEAARILASGQVGFLAAQRQSGGLKRYLIQQGCVRTDVSEYHLQYKSLTDGETDDIVWPKQSNMKTNPFSVSTFYCRREGPRWFFTRNIEATTPYPYPSGNPYNIKIPHPAYTTTAQALTYYREERNKDCIPGDTEIPTPPCGPGAQNDQRASLIHTARIYFGHIAEKMVFNTTNDLNDPLRWNQDYDWRVQSAFHPFNYSARVTMGAFDFTGAQSSIAKGEPVLVFEGDPRFAYATGDKFVTYDAWFGTHLVVGTKKVLDDLTSCGFPFSQTTLTKKWFYLSDVDDYGISFERFGKSAGVHNNWAVLSVGEPLPTLAQSPDCDKDGYGTNDPTKRVVDCRLREEKDGCKYSDKMGDCNDQKDLICPGCKERCNGIDDNCDKMKPLEDDSDGDQYIECTGFIDDQVGLKGGGDCKPTDPAIHPGADEGCDGVDTDCDGSLPKAEWDSDQDSYMVCEKDCDDSKDSGFPIHPGATETCDEKDNDCDQQIDEDFYYKGWSCHAGQGDCKRYGSYVCTSDHLGITCNATAGLPTQEICDGKDNDCNSWIDDGLGANITSYYDADKDGWGGNTISIGCSVPPGYVTQGIDCDDTNPAVHSLACPGGYSPWYDNYCYRYPVNSDCGSCGGYVGSTCEERTHQGCWYDAQVRACRFRDNAGCYGDCAQTHCPDGWADLGCDEDGVKCGKTCGYTDPASRFCGRAPDCAGGLGFSEPWGRCWAVRTCQ